VPAKAELAQSSDTLSSRVVPTNSPSQLFRGRRFDEIAFHFREGNGASFTGAAIDQHPTKRSRLNCLSDRAHLLHFIFQRPL
jgi:hypothetical protein